MNPQRAAGSGKASFPKFSPARIGRASYASPHFLGATGANSRSNQGLAVARPSMDFPMNSGRPMKGDWGFLRCLARKDPLKLEFTLAEVNNYAPRTAQQTKCCLQHRAVGCTNPVTLR
jgi:hypothetical protein